MQPSRPMPPPAVPTATLERLLRGFLQVRGLRKTIVEVRRQAAPYYSSHLLEELSVRLEGGARLSLVFKDLSPGTLVEDADRIKPAFLRDPAREAMAYELLEAAGVRAPRCFGYHAALAAGEYFLFLEKAPGVPLWQIGEISVWRAVAAAMGAAHGAMAHVAATGGAPLLAYSRSFFKAWPERVREYLIRRSRADTRAKALDRVMAGYPSVIDRLVRLPTTMIHGEFHASNVLVDETPEGPKVYPVDWEMAGVGPGLLDLADLTAGKWSEDERRSLVDAYRQALPAALSPPPGDFEAALDACRLHKAVQWLGWAPDWEPPEEHRHDWLDEALRLGEKLGLG